MADRERERGGDGALLPAPSKLQLISKLKPVSKAIKNNLQVRV